MSDSEKRQAASRKLADAIQEHMETLGPVEGMLGDWIVISCTVAIDGQGDPITQYHMGFSNGVMLDHHALGLLTKAQDMLVNGEVSDGGPAESA